MSSSVVNLSVAVGLNHRRASVTNDRWLLTALSQYPAAAALAEAVDRHESNGNSYSHLSLHCNTLLDGAKQ